jgi:hypothetical protein
MTIPAEIIAALESEAAGLFFGRLNLEIIISDGVPKFRILKEISIKPGTQKKTGGGHA